MAPARHWGQNFLINKNVLEEIAVLAGAGPEVHMLEIGPGLGALTLSLLERGARVSAIEVDQRVKEQLGDIANHFPGQLEVTYADALNCSWDKVVGALGTAVPAVSIVGNLPYYITAPLLGKILETSLHWTRATIMVQKEVADRLATEPGHRLSSALGVILRYRADVIVGIDRVDPSNFYPAPEVFSTVIQLVPHPPLPVSFDTFRWVVRSGFRHRRKTLRQALALSGHSPLSKNQWHTFLESIGIASSLRAEALSMEEWLRLAVAVDKRGDWGDFRKPDQGPDEF